MRAVLLLAVGVSLLAAGCAGESADDPAVPQGRFLAASSSLTPNTVFFGDSFRARLEVVVDRDRLDPDRIRLAAAFTPYKQVGALRVSRRDYDRYTRLEFESTLRCLEVACLAGEVSPGGPGEVLPGQAPPSRRGERVFRFQPAHLYYDQASGRPRHLKRVWWPRLDVLTRISPTDPSLTFAFNTPFRTTLKPLPDVSYRTSPSLVAAGLLAGAGLLLVLPAWMTFAWWRRRRPEPVTVVEAPLTPLERALALVEQARSADVEERRGALEVLAIELEASDRPELARDARALAWSAAAPTPERADALVATVRQADEA